MPQAAFLNSGISGYEYLDKIVQVPFCLPNLELRRKQAFLNKMVEEKELEPKRVLARIQKELQSAKKLVYVPLDPRPAGDTGKSRADDRLRTLVRAAQRLREAKLLKEDPMRRAEIGISDEGLIKQIETDGDKARPDQKESFLFMLSEAAERQSAARQASKAAASRSVQPVPAEEGAGKEEPFVTGAPSTANEGESASERSEEREEELEKVIPEYVEQEEAALLLTGEGGVGKNTGQEAPFVVLWNGVLQAELSRLMEESGTSALKATQASD